MQGVQLDMDEENELCFVSTINSRSNESFFDCICFSIEKYYARTPAESWLDTQFSAFGSPEEPLTSMFFGPMFVSSKLYQLCSLEVL